MGGEKMGFIDALHGIGALGKKEGLDNYLKFPLDQEGKVIRVFLKAENFSEDILDIKGVSGIELEDLKKTPEMKRKYLYRDRVGSNVFWGFSMATAPLP